MSPTVAFGVSILLAFIIILLAVAFIATMSYICYEVYKVLKDPDSVMLIDKPKCGGCGKCNKLQK